MYIHYSISVAQVLSLRLMYNTTQQFQDQLLAISVFLKLKVCFILNEFSVIMSKIKIFKKLHNVKSKK